MVYNKGVQKSQKGANANLTFFQNGKNEPKMKVFYHIMLVGMNNFCTFAKVIAITVITNTILRYEVLR